MSDHEKSVVVAPDIQGGASGGPPTYKIATALFIAAFLFAALTISDFGITWDEPGYVYQAQRMRAWFALLVAHPGEAVSDNSIRNHWPVWEGNQPRQPGNESIQDRLNPPLAIMSGALFGAIFEGSLGTFPSHRLIGPLAYAVIVALLYLWVGRAGGQWAGLGAGLSFALLPRMFGHAHFFATDLPATALMLLAAFALMNHPRSRRWQVAFGVILGLAMATKFTAIILPVPLIIWAAIKKDRRVLMLAVTAPFIALPVSIIVNPALWHGTFQRLWYYLLFSVERSHFIAIPTYYFGKVYWFKLPWHQPWVMVFGTMPIVMVVFTMIGAGRVLSRREKSPDALFGIIAFLVLMATFMTPSAPGHDGVRLFMPAYVFLAALCGFGIRWLTDRLRTKGARIIALAILLQPGLTGIIRWHPYELSFYGLALGGPEGAHELGMETTYWMDALTPENEDEIRRVTEGAPRRFAAYFEQPLSWRAQVGRLGEGAVVTNDDPYWALLIGRQGMMDDTVRLAWDWGTPEWEAVRRGVRLVALFEFGKMFDGIGARLDGLNQNDAKTWYLKGLLGEAIGDNALALADFDKARSIRPNIDRLELHRGRVLRELGRSPESINIFNTLISKDPSAENYHELARSYLAAGDRVRAAEAYRRVLEIHLNYPGALQEFMRLQSEPIQP